MVQLLHELIQSYLYIADLSVMVLCQAVCCAKNIVRLPFILEASDDLCGYHDHVLCWQMLYLGREFELLENVYAVDKKRYS